MCAGVVATSGSSTTANGEVGGGDKLFTVDLTGGSDDTSESGESETHLVEDGDPGQRPGRGLEMVDLGADTQQKKPPRKRPVLVVSCNSLGLCIYMYC